MAGWLVTARGGIEKYTPSDMCWSNQGVEGGRMEDGGRQPFKSELRQREGERERVRGVQELPYSSHFIQNLTTAACYKKWRGFLGDTHTQRQKEKERGKQTWNRANQIWQWRFSYLYFRYFLSISKSKPFQNKTGNSNPWGFPRFQTCPDQTWCHFVATK